MQNPYDICTAISALVLQRPVAFATSTGIPLLDAQYLKLHAAVCHVAGCVVCESDVDSRVVLACDADILYFGLQKARAVNFLA